MIYTSIDLGSDSVKIIVSEYIDDKYNVLASINTRMVGIKKGIIRDSGMVIKSLEVALLEIEKQLGFKVDKAIVSIPCYDAEIGVFSGETDITGLVSGSDIVSCFKNAIKNNVDGNREVITVFPIDFLINEDEKVIDPKGLDAYKLSTRVIISTLPKELVYMYLEVFEKCNIEVIDLCLSTIGDYYQAEKKEYQKSIGAVVNIGSSKIEIGLFNKGLMIKSDILSIGSKKVDQDIKYVFQIDSMTARNLKENFAIANSQYSENDVLEITNVDGESFIISQREISQVVEARLLELLKSVKKHLNDLTNKEISYIIVTGGISDIPGFNSLLESVFKDATNMMSVNILGVRNNMYSSCMGMIKYLHEKLELRGINYTMIDKSTLKKDKHKTSLNDYVINKIEGYINSN